MSTDDSTAPGPSPHAAGFQILVLGARGLCGVPGGVESHCRELYPRLVRRGWRVKVLARGRRPLHFEGSSVEIMFLPMPAPSSLEPLLHTMLGVLYAGFTRPDLVHIHAIGPSMLVGMARILGLRVAVTHHGADYERRQWDKLARFVLRTAERLGVRHANKVIAVTERTRVRLTTRWPDANVEYIPNGVPFPRPVPGTRFIEKLGLRPGEYILSVGRFVPDKGLHDLVAAFGRLRGSRADLVLVGGPPVLSAYDRELRRAAMAEGVVLPGLLFGEELAQIYAYAGLFVLPSYHEEQSIALLEAMSFGVNLLVSDIPANRDFDLDAEDYFETGNVAELLRGIERKYNAPVPDHYPIRVREHFDWETIADTTDRVLRSLCGSNVSDQEM